jgi:two-component sensor histidine kinase
MLCAPIPEDTNMDSAVPLGSIVDELVSNALEHAFRGRASGKNCVSLSRQE